MISIKNHIARYFLTLALIIGAPIGAHVACMPAGQIVQAIDSVNDPSDDVALRKCRAEMRAAKDAGADASSAFKTYYDCTVDAGVR